MEKLVSIVLPVYNVNRFLKGSIESCLRQTYQNVELIIVDDGSTDDVTGIVNSYDDNRLKLIRHTTNRGLAAALNTGFNHALGTYLTWTSDDNYYTPNAVEELVKYLDKNNDVYFVYANYFEVDEFDRLLRLVRTGPLNKLIEYNCVGPCFLYRHALYEKVGAYNERAPLVEDYEYWFRASNYFSFDHLNKPLYYYRLRPDSLTSRFPAERCIAVLSLQKQFFGQNSWRNRTTLSKVYIRAADDLYYKAQKRYEAARAVLWSIVLNPKFILHRNVQRLVIKIFFGKTFHRLVAQANDFIRSIPNKFPRY